MTSHSYFTFCLQLRHFILFLLPGCEHLLPQVLTYLSLSDLKQFHLYFCQHTTQDAMISINNASRASCIQEVESMSNTTPRFNKHDVYKRQRSSLFSSSTSIRDMISRNVNPNHTNYMQEYTSLRFGPQTTKPYNIFVGQGLNHNKFPITQTRGR